MTSSHPLWHVLLGAVEGIHPSTRVTSCHAASWCLMRRPVHRRPAGERALSCERGIALRRDGSTFTWWKSSYSEAGATCCEVAFTGARMLVRDSKRPGIGILSFTPQAWQAIVRHVRAEGRSGPVGK
ncbi:DUF397 domain-containing protein [Streptomyces sp. cg40]|uniref:DUF397 domain-containing protein n=1 Tax=Streptomyces sp. cg40 TaxID=3419764 RepID=UPI003D088F01